MKAKETSDYPLDSGCRICGRVPWGRWQYIGFGHWRHDECAIGSKDWQDYYNALPHGEAKTRLAEYASCLEKGI